MELRRLLALFRQRVVLIIVVAIAGAAGGYFSTSRVPMYSSSATIFVGEPATNPNSNTQAEQALIATTFAAIVPTPAVATVAISDTHVARSVGSVVGETKSTVIVGTNLIVVSVKDPDPVTAQTLANGMATAFVNEAEKIAPLTSATGQPSTVPPATVTQPAGLPTEPLSTGLKRNVALGGIFGLVVGASLVLLLDYLDLSARLPEDVERLTGLPVLGVIPFQPAYAASGVGSQSRLAAPTASNRVG